jgi:hypothetical protein
VTEAASYAVDRTGWPPGPWDQEPDRIEWRARAGLPCLIVRSPSVGVLCGYVGLPPGHRYHGVDAEAVDVEVPVDLCYSAPCRGAICHVPAPGKAEDVWWIGFDCAHAHDLMPFVAERFAGHGLVYRDVAHVTALVNALAEQLAGVGPEEPTIGACDLGG